jgi:hypothetical protein
MKSYVVRLSKPIQQEKNNCIRLTTNGKKKRLHVLRQRRNSSASFIEFECVMMCLFIYSCYLPENLIFVIIIMIL